MMKLSKWELYAYTMFMRDEFQDHYTIYKNLIDYIQDGSLFNDPKSLLIILKDLTNTYVSYATKFEECKYMSLILEELSPLYIAESLAGSFDDFPNSKNLIDQGYVAYFADLKNLSEKERLDNFNTLYSFAKMKAKEEVYSILKNIDFYQKELSIARGLGASTTE